MLVNSVKMKELRQSKNWTQQHLADVCDLSMRTIQRVEKDGVASNETVAAYAAIFEVELSNFLIPVKEFGGSGKQVSQSKFSTALGGALFVGGFVAGIGLGIGLTMWLF